MDFDERPPRNFQNTPTSSIPIILLRLRNEVRGLERHIDFKVNVERNALIMRLMMTIPRCRNEDIVAAPEFIQFEEQLNRLGTRMMMAQIEIGDWEEEMERREREGL